MKNVVQDLTSAGIDWQREKWQSGLGSKFIHQGEKNAVKYADEVIVLSKGVQDYFKKTDGRETHFIPNGVNIAARKSLFMPVNRSIPDVAQKRKDWNCLISGFKASDLVFLDESGCNTDILQPPYACMGLKNHRLAAASVPVRGICGRAGYAGRRTGTAGAQAAAPGTGRQLPCRAAGF